MAASPAPPNAQDLVRRVEQAIASRNLTAVRLDYPVLLKAPLAPVHFYRLGILEAEAGDEAAAIKLLRAALAKAPDEQNILINLATLATARRPKRAA